MNIQARIRLRNWFLDTWPDRDLDNHVIVIDAINLAVVQGLLTWSEIFHLFRYLAGYEDRSREAQIDRAIMVLGTLLEYDDREYAQSKLGRVDNQMLDIAVTEMNAIGLWANYE